MAERGWSRASVRARTTTAAVLVVAVALLVGAVVLVALVRGSLRDGVEAGAEQRAASLVGQVEGTGPPDVRVEGDDDDDEPDELVWQVLDAGGDVVRASHELGRPLPAEDGDDVRIPGSDHDWVVVREEAEVGESSYDVVVAASLEDVEESTQALVWPLAVGLPLLLLLVGGTTWVVAGRALAPVERMRREVDQITGDRLDRRVPEPGSRDEVHRLARTMNQMLARLEAARDRQQQFVGDASHELRSPLASIRQAAEVAHAHPGALPEGELAETVLEESTRMQRLVEQLLLLTRADEGALAREEVDLDDVAIAVARRAGRDDVKVDNSGVAPARVSGDRGALTQVAQNLVDNALRHARTTVAVSVGESGGVAELRVEDDGSGLAPDDRERVFERFVRLDEARARDDGGSGLGLAIVAAIVRAHGGSVAVETAGLGGAAFVVRLPALPG